MAAIATVALVRYGCFLILGMGVSVLALIAELHSHMRLWKLTELSQGVPTVATMFSLRAEIATKFAETPPSPHIPYE